MALSGELKQKPLITEPPPREASWLTVGPIQQVLRVAHAARTASL